MLDAFISGVALCLGLCLVFGPQNIFVLRTGIDGKNRWAVILTSFFCEIGLLVISVFGIGLWLQSVPMLLMLISLGGTGFLAYYGLIAIKNVIKNDYEIQSLEDTKESTPRSRLKMAVFTAFAMACLNPGSLMDTMIIIPGIAASFDLNGKYAFLSGHLLTIFLWFSALCFAATQMRRLFKNPKAWQALDLLVFIMMAYLVVKMSISTAAYF